MDKFGLLGGWVDEIKEGHFISVRKLDGDPIRWQTLWPPQQEFVATAPKCYTYLVRSEEDKFGPPVSSKIRMKGEPAHWGWGTGRAFLLSLWQGSV